MFYFGMVCGAAVGFLASIAFPGVVAKLRAGYFKRLHQAEHLVGGGSGGGGNE